MAKRRRRKLSASGPYLATAVLCEKVLQEKDGVAILIRIVDRVSVTGAGTEAPEDMPPVTLSFTLALGFKAGIARGKYAVSVRGETPSGEVLPEVTMSVLFEGEERGVNVFMNLNFQAKEEGLFWFDVLLEGALVTRVPLRVLYQRLTQGS